MLRPYLTRYGPMSHVTPVSHTLPRNHYGSNSSNANVPGNTGGRGRGRSGVAAGGGPKSRHGFGVGAAHKGFEARGAKVFEVGAQKDWGYGRATDLG
jgi:hypothetical protein